MLIWKKWRCRENDNLQNFYIDIDSMEVGYLFHVEFVNLTFNFKTLGFNKGPVTLTPPYLQKMGQNRIKQGQSILRIPISSLFLV